jgi:oligopeptide transport system permease protein
MKVNSAAFLFLLIIALAALLAPWLAPYSYETQNLDKILIGPTGDHWFGTDYLGRDLLSRILYGARVSLFVGIGTGLVAFLFGLVLVG